MEATHTFPRRIFRPTIVIGHSRYMTATNFTGVYGFLRKLYAFRGILERAQAELVLTKTVQVKAEEQAPLNVVPIDCVASEAVQIWKRTRSEPDALAFFHLSNPKPPTVGDVISPMFEILGMPRPRYVLDSNEFDWLDEKFNSRIDFYRTYLRGHKDFDRTQTEPHCADTVPCPVYTEQTLRPFLSWYLALLEQERGNLPTGR